MIDRQTDIRLVRNALRRNRVVVLPGPPQCGKTTLARQFVAADSVNYFDLEDPGGVARPTEPNTALRPLKGLVVENHLDDADQVPAVSFVANCKKSPNTTGLAMYTVAPASRHRSRSPGIASAVKAMIGTSPMAGSCRMR